MPKLPPTSPVITRTAVSGISNTGARSGSAAGADSAGRCKACTGRGADHNPPGSHAVPSPLPLRGYLLAFVKRHDRQAELPRRQPRHRPSSSTNEILSGQSGHAGESTAIAFFQMGDRGQRFVVDEDHLCRIACLRRRFRHHKRHRVADHLHLLGDQRRVIGMINRRTVGARLGRVRKVDRRSFRPPSPSRSARSRTPGAASAVEISTDRISAFACGDRST